MDHPITKAREFFLLVHIMKTAGTTFNEVLRRNFGPAFIAEYGLLNNYQYSEAQVSKILESYPNLRSVASHRFSLNLPWDIPGVDLRAITYIREPAARIVSLYFFKRCQDISPRNRREKSMSLPDWLEWALENRQFQTIDHQAKFLFGEAAESGPDRARELAEMGRLLIFPSERFNESLLVLGRLFPAWFFNFRYDRKMVSIKDQPVTAELLDGIRAKQTLDTALHQFAGHELDRLIAECFPDREEFEQELAKFDD